MTENPPITAAAGAFAENVLNLPGVEKTFSCVACAIIQSRKYLWRQVRS